MTTRPQPPMPGSSRPAREEGDPLQEVRDSLHDIRNHLNAILGLISLMLMQSRDATVARFRPMVEEQSEQLRYLIDQLGSPPRVDSTPRPRESITQPARLLSALADLYAPFAAEHGTRLECAADPGTPGLQTDTRALHRLLSNLLVNAIKHAQSSLIVLRAAPLDARRPTAGVRFVVVDDGVGLDARALQSLNGVLSGRCELSPKYDRMGLGIVARLARELGAGVMLDSEPDDGTTATVVVPAMRDPSRAPPT